MVELVVRAQCDQRPKAYAIGVENLRAGILPHRCLIEFGYVGREVKGDAGHRPGQSETAKEQHKEEEVGEEGAEVNELKDMCLS